MFFSSVKEINRLINKRMSNIYSKVTIEKNWCSQNFIKKFYKFKKLVSKSVFRVLQLKQVSLNFETSCCNVKVRGMGAKVCGFCIILILKGIMIF